jgi:hypothetical protein
MLGVARREFILVAPATTLAGGGLAGSCAMDNEGERNGFNTVRG